MTRRDFQLIADAVKEARAWDDVSPSPRPGVIDSVARSLADALAGTNPRFDRARFLRACGVE